MRTGGTLHTEIVDDLGLPAQLVPVLRGVGPNARTPLLGRFGPDVSRCGDDILLRRRQLGRRGNRLHQFGARLVFAADRLRLQRKHAGEIAGKLRGRGFVGAIGRRTHAAGDQQAGDDQRRSQNRARAKISTHQIQSHCKPPLHRPRIAIRTMRLVHIRRKSGDNLSIGVCRFYLKRPSRATTGRFFHDRRCI